MRHFLLRHHVQKEILFKRNMHRKDIERSFLNKLATLISSDMEKKLLKIFFWQQQPFQYRKSDY